MIRLSGFLITLISLVFIPLSAVQAEPKHGIAMYGEPALPAGFKNLPYVNPDAPKGGRIVFGEGGGFDSLNPYILKGRAPWGVRAHMVESLMGRSWDEPFTLYGLLAETIETGPDRKWVEFTLRREAEFSDGSPVTVEDVIWSFETLGTLGHPRYQNSYTKIEAIEKTGERTVKISFNVDDLEAALTAGLRPILKKGDWEGRAFDESSLEPFVASGPYVLGEFEADRFISFKRNPNYWGKDLAFNKGLHNLDEIRYDFFQDASVIFEAFKAGETSVFREGSPARWDDSYDFPRAKNGEVSKTIIVNRRPSGITGFVMNTRRPLFQDWRVREAMIQAFNFEFINQTLNAGGNPRITSYFANSVLAMEDGAASGLVAEKLAPFADQLLPGTIDGYALAVSDGSEQNRKNLRTATKLLSEAGWTIQDGVLKNEAGEAFEFELLLRSGSSSTEAAANIYADALKRLGIAMNISLVDSAQAKERTNIYDFDMTYYRRGLSLSPGNEQKLYWAAEGIEKPGTRNWMGMNSPAAEAMIDAMLNAQSQDDYVASVRALDRILTAGRYVVPIWHSPITRLAHDSKLKIPEYTQMYGDWIGFMPDVFWSE